MFALQHASIKDTNLDFAALRNKDRCVDYSSFCTTTSVALGVIIRFSHIGHSCQPLLNPMRLRSSSLLVLSNSSVLLCQEVLGAIDSSRKLKMVSRVKVVCY